MKRPTPAARAAAIISGSLSYKVLSAKWQWLSVSMMKEGSMQVEQYNANTVRLTVVEIMGGGSGGGLCMQKREWRVGYVSWPGQRADI